MTTAFLRRRRLGTAQDGQEDFGAAVRRAAQHLPFEQARALWLVDVCGLTYALAAAQAGSTPKRFAGHLHAARDSIRRALR